MFRAYRPSSANIAPDWLRAKSSPVDEEEIKIKMDGGAARFFTHFGKNKYYLLTCGRRILVSGTQNEIIVS